MHRLGIELAKLTSVTVTLNYTVDSIYFVFEVVDQVEQRTQYRYR